MIILQIGEIKINKTTLSIRLNIITKNEFISKFWAVTKVSNILKNLKKKLIKLSRRCHWQSKSFEYLLGFFYCSAENEKKKKWNFQFAQLFFFRVCDTYICNGFRLSNWLTNERRNCINRSKLATIELCCSQTRGSVLTMMCDLVAASVGAHI